MSVKIAESDADLTRISAVLLELRGTFTRHALIAQIKAQQQDISRHHFSITDLAASERA